MSCLSGTGLLGSKKAFYCIMVTAVHMVLGGGGGSRERKEHLCIYAEVAPVDSISIFFASQGFEGKERLKGPN